LGTSASPVGQPQAAARELRHTSRNSPSQTVALMRRRPAANMCPAGKGRAGVARPPPFNLYGSRLALERSEGSAVVPHRIPPIASKECCHPERSEGSAVVPHRIPPRASKECCHPERSEGSAVVPIPGRPLAPSPPRHFLGLRHHEYAHKKSERRSHQQKGEASCGVVEALHSSRLKTQSSKSHLPLFPITFLGTESLPRQSNRRIKISNSASLAVRMEPAVLFPIHTCAGSKWA
jgi:hypothetical protein